MCGVIVELYRSREDAGSRDTVMGLWEGGGRGLRGEGGARACLRETNLKII